MAGDRIGSLRLFESWRAKLAEELGAAPTQDLEYLAERLRRSRSLRGCPAAAQSAPSLFQNPTVHIGRYPEFAACYDAWTEVQNGNGRHVLVVGECGIGKSALVSRVTTALGLEGATIIRTQGHDLERELPFGVLGSLVEQLIDVPGAGGTAPEQLAELGRVVTKVRVRWPSLPRASEASGECARVQFTDAVHALITTLTFERPVVAVIDDIHFADAASLAVLHALLRRSSSLPLMVIANSLGTRDDLPHLVSALTRQVSAHGFTTIELGPLSEAEGQELLSSLIASGADPGPTVRRALLAGAQGNPMVLELLVAAWTRHGPAALALAYGAMTGAGPDVTMRNLVTTAIGNLDNACRAVVNLAAVLGRRLNDLRLYALVDLSVPETMRAMTVLTSQRILRDTGDQLEFTNALVRGECYAAMAGTLRKMLHSAVADALTVEQRPSPHVLDLEIAWQLVRGGRLTEAVPYLLSGGEASIQSGAPHEADFALSTGLPELTGQDRSTAILLLSEALQELGRWQESLHLLNSPWHPTELSDEGWRDALQVVGKRWTGSLSQTDLCAGVDRMIEISNSTCSPAVRAKAVAAAIRLLTISRDEPRIALLATVIDNMCNVAATPYERLHIVLAGAWTLNATRQPAAALGHLQMGVNLAKEHGFRSSITVRLLVGLGNTLSVLGRYREAIVPLREGERIAMHLENDTLIAECSTQLAVAYGRLGDRPAQIEWARCAIHRFPAHDRSPGALGAVYELGIGLALEGRSAEAKAVATDLTAQAPPRESGWIRQASLLCAADILNLSGHPRRASKLARAGLLEGNKGLLNESYAGQYARWVAQTSIEDEAPKAGLGRLFAEFPSPESLHVKDRAELFAARAYLTQLTGVSAGDEWQAVRGELESLPSGVSMVIRALGLHPDQQPQ